VTKVLLIQVYVTSVIMSVKSVKGKVKGRVQLINLVIIIDEKTLMVALHVVI
jgi:hypothetical protein